MKLINRVGQKYGRLTVENRASSKGKKTYWNCICDCGTRLVISGDSLQQEKAKSCGCLRKDTPKRLFTTHGEATGYARSPEYQSWIGMRQRCRDPKSTRWNIYGGRGIKVCDRWIDSFDNFLADMGRKPTRKHSIDRIDVNGNYEPSNCRWATPYEQVMNRRVG